MLGAVLASMSLRLHILFNNRYFFSVVFPSQLEEFFSGQLRSILKYNRHVSRGRHGSSVVGGTWICVAGEHKFSAMGRNIDLAQWANIDLAHPVGFCQNR